MGGVSATSLPGAPSPPRIATLPGPVMTVAWITPAAIPATETSLLTVNLGTRYQIGFKRIGDEIARFVFDNETGTQTNLTGAYVDLPEQTSMVVGLRELPGVASPVDWYSVVNVDGNDVARCPAEGSLTFSDDEAVEDSSSVSSTTAPTTTTTAPPTTTTTVYVPPPTAPPPTAPPPTAPAAQSGVNPGSFCSPVGAHGTAPRERR